jgi:hypothetical protein
LEIKNLAENVNRLSVTIERLITHKEKELWENYLQTSLLI